MAGPEKLMVDPSDAAIPGTVLPPAEEGGTKRPKKARGEHHEYPLNITAMMDMMTIILVYLLKSYSSDPGSVQTSEDLKLANSSTRFRSEEAVPVAVTKKGILVNDKNVAPVKDGKVPAEYKKGQDNTSYIITPLLTAMKAEAEKQKYIAKNNANKEFKGLALIIGDKSIPYRLITEVMYTVGLAEFGQYKFVVTMQQ